MSNSNKPKNLDFGAMEQKLRKMGVNSNLDHLKRTQSNSEVSPPQTPSSQVPATQEQQIKPQQIKEQQTQLMAAQQSIATTNQENERAPSDWCNYIFGTLLSIYESTWIKSYGRRPTGRFLDFADSVTEAELMRIMQHCRERLQAGEKWPPIMGELTLLKNQPTESELAESFNRVSAKDPQNQIEKWIMQNKGYELRRLPQSMINKRFKEFYLEAQSLQEKGKLVTEPPKALAQYSVKNLVDVKREEYQRKHGGELDPRIQAILDSKKES
ncbi:hypothetical protein [Vibrio hippocampi]|uniref:Uncharacterized protein n=1 Tax=Vibrio hippocampi TaxID=654686 RepID=A0ABN8DGR2_9VIBR|nr:hypothetical protein [Vibrio hippocampi]CAH0524592.1 hypothetical protein VHP8226_00432 [Vibrio hippocampi]